MPYTVSEAVSGLKVTYSIGAVPIAEIKNVSGPSIKADVVDVSNVTTSDGFAQSLVGLIDGGEVSFDLNIVPGTGGWAALVALWAAGTKSAHVITWAAGKTCTFQGIITALSPTAPLAGGATASATCKVCSLPVFALA